MDTQEYALGSSAHAARRLAVQDQQFAAISESLLDELQVRPHDRVWELGIGAGSFSRRVLRRLGAEGVFVGVDFTPGLLEQAKAYLQGASPARLELVCADIRDVAKQAREADVIVARTVLHHLPLPESFLGVLWNDLRPATRLGFIEPEFRVMQGNLARLIAQGRTELAPLLRWAEGISRYYQQAGLAPTIGASLGTTLQASGYRNVQSMWWECPTDAAALENMRLYYDEIKARYVSQGIMSAAAMEQDQQRLADLPPNNLPPVWGMYRVTCEA